jgi:hypothetical protein
MTQVLIKIDQEKFNRMFADGVFTKYEATHEIKEVIINDDFFKDDVTHSELNRVSVKAYKDLKIYEFNKRHNIKTK